MTITSRVAAWLGAMLLGVTAGTLGTFTFRSLPPFGVIIALLTVAALGIVLRSKYGLSGLLLFSAGWLITVQFLVTPGPGNNALVPAEVLAYAWVYGGVIPLFFAMFAPRSWFSTRPVRFLSERRGEAAPPTSPESA